MSRTITIEEILDEFYSRRDEIEIPIDKVKQDLSEFDGVVLYGAGSAGIAFLHYLLDAGIKPLYFSDGDTEKQGTVIENLKVLAPTEITSTMGENCLVIVTINTDGEHYCKDFKEELLRGGHQGVHKALRDAGCKNVIDYTYFRRCYGLFTNEKYNLPACSSVNIMLDNLDRIREAFNLFSDEETRDTYRRLLEFRLLSDDVDIPVYPENRMYFEYDLFPKTEEVFIDCGACGGSSLDGYLDVYGDQFAGYYGIEPDPTNFDKLAKKIDSMDPTLQEKMHTINAAAWDTDAETNFFVLSGPGTFQADVGPDVVPTVQIDTLLQGKPATYIKMNIEGSEIPALKGAEKTIRAHKPRLGIMGYHKTSDLWEVPLLIKRYRNDYELRLRSYMKNVAFTYYAF